MGIGSLFARVLNLAVLTSSLASEIKQSADFIPKISATQVGYCSNRHSVLHVSGFDGVLK